MADPGGVRSLPARFGIVALNFMGPGLGLMRLGRLREAALFYFIPLAVFVATVLLWAVTPVLSFAWLLISAAPFILAGIAALLGSGWRSWRESSAPIPAVRSRWSSWYAVTAAAILSILVSQPIPTIAHGFYKPFYIPSEAMAPTLLRNDRIVADMRGPASLRRGEIILFRVGPYVYNKRIAALPGDVIELKNGVVVLNGKPVPQRLLGRDSFDSYAGRVEARHLLEQFPGESRPHEIFDQEWTAVDNVPPVRVPPGHLYVLGDNRDSSADSRVPISEGGVELLPISDVIGKALYYTFGPSHRSGQTIGPAR